MYIVHVHEIANQTYDELSSNYSFVHNAYNF